MITAIRSAISSPASIGLLKFLKESGFRVIGTDIINKSVGNFFVDAFYEVPRASDEQAVIKCYKKIVVQENARWIISGPEEEIKILKKHEKILGVSVMHPPIETLEIVTDKLLAFQYFSKNGFLTPQSYKLNIRKLPPLQGKMILKPRRGRGSTGIFVIDGRQQLEHSLYANSISRGYMVQEFIEGEEWTVDTLHDMEGNLLNVVPRHRLKIDSGISIVSRTVRDEYLFELIVKISSLLHFAGGGCFQFIKDKSGKYYLTDINPRFGGGAILSLNASISFQYNLIQLLKGESLRSQNPSFDFFELHMYRYYKEFYE